MDSKQTIDALVEKFNLLPHPEGGFYAETFRSDVKITADEFEGTRKASTAIYFLLVPGKVRLCIYTYIYIITCLTYVHTSTCNILL